MRQARVPRRAGGLLALLLWPALSTPAQPPLPTVAPELPVERRAAGRPLSPPPGARGMRVALHEDLRFRYLEVELGAAPEGTPRPLVLVLHGRGDGPRIPTGDYTEGLPVRLVLPFAPEGLGVGWSWLATSVLDGRDRDLADELRVRADELASFLVQLEARHRTRGRPVVTGFSQGGMLTLALAFRHPETLRAAVPLGAWVPAALAREARPSETPRIRALHGEADPIMGLGRTRALYAGLDARGFDALLETFPEIPHRMSEAMKAQHERLLLEALATPRPLRGRGGSAEPVERAMAVPR